MLGHIPQFPGTITEQIHCHYATVTDVMKPPDRLSPSLSLALGEFGIGIPKPNIVLTQE
jgi:hypothetical protein